VLLGHLIVKKVLIIHKLYYFSETKNIIAAFAKQPGLIMDKKNSTFCGFLLLVLFSLVALNVNAQDSGSPSFEAYEKDPAEPVFFTRGDSSESVISPRKDSSSLRIPLKRNVYKPAPVVPKEKSNSDPNDNSVLSFNFLYYLIQKYKMQDIVD
jgi:hypothetical protein